MPDTLKAQHTAYLTTGCVCYSDMGRILCSITDDTCGWHDTLCGVTDAAHDRRAVRRNALPGTAQRRYVSGYDGMLNELGKYGLGKRDLVANINFFSKVTVDDAGALQLSRGPLASRPVRRSALRDEHARACCTPGRIRSIRPPSTRHRPCRLQARRHSRPARERSLSHALSGERTRLQQHRTAVR